jgi:putative spermidine/putrescine transport system permease protein
LSVEAYPAGRPPGTARRRLSAAFWRRPWLRATSLLAAPLAWFVLLYLAALAVLFISAFWTLDTFTGKVVHDWTFDNFREVFSNSTYRAIAYRTIGIAALVTITDALLAFPFAYFMARVAKPRTRTLLFVLVLLPLWSSYLARIYAWRLILAQEGALNWSLDKVGLPTQDFAYTNTAMWIVFSYVWTPMSRPRVTSAQRAGRPSAASSSRSLCPV